MKLLPAARTNYLRFPDKEGNLLKVGDRAIQEGGNHEMAFMIFVRIDGERADGLIYTSVMKYYESVALPSQLTKLYHKEPPELEKGL